MTNPEITQNSEIGHDLREEFSGLLSILRMETHLYQELLELITREKMVLLRPSLSALQESNTRKETLILKSKMLEEARAQSTRKLGEALGLDQTGLTLSALVRHADPVTGQELTEYQKVLKSIVEKIGALNVANRSLIDASLLSINGLVGFINQIMNAGPTYQGNGEVSNLRGSGKFVCTQG